MRRSNRTSVSVYGIRITITNALPVKKSFTIPFGCKIHSPFSKRNIPEKNFYIRQILVSNVSTICQRHSPKISEF